MDRVVVREKKWVIGLGIYWILYWGVVFGLICGQYYRAQDWSGLFVAGAVGIVFLLPGIAFFLSGVNRKLILGTQECCYCTMFRRKTRFVLEDIGKVEWKEKKEVIEGELTTREPQVTLWDRSGKKLARFEENMENAAEALYFIQNHRTSAETANIEEDEETEISIQMIASASGFMCCLIGLMLVLETFFRNQGVRVMDLAFSSFALFFGILSAFLWLYGKYFKRRNVYFKLFNALLEEENPAFYQTKGRLGAIWILASLLNLAGILLAGTYWLLPMSVYIKLSLINLFIPWIFYLCFPRVMGWMPSFLSGKLMVPWVGAIYFSFASTYFTYIHTENEEWVMHVRIGLAVVMVILYLVPYYGEFLLGLFYGGVLGLSVFLFTEELPVLFDTGEAWHQEAEVVEKEEIPSPRNATSYYLILEVENGRTKKIRVSEAVYLDIQESDMVQLCWHSSLLEDYYYIHMDGEACDRLW